MEDEINKHLKKLKINKFSFFRKKNGWIISFTHYKIIIRGGKCGGVIFDSNGQKVTNFSWSLRKNTNNRAKTLAMYMGLQIAHSRSIQALTVIGDSEIVIKELLGLSTTATQASSGLRTRINSLKHLFLIIHYFHILRSQNTEADCLAKSTKSLEHGHLFIYQIFLHAWLP